MTDQQTFAPTDLEGRKAFAIAQGVDPNKIQSVQMQLEILRRNGILVDLDVRGESMFSRAATWLETGVWDRETQEYFTRGRKSFFPKHEKKIKSIVARMRQNLADYPKIAGFHPWSWINWRAYPTWKAEQERLTQEFEDAKKDLLDHYDSELETVLQDYRHIAHNAWVRLVSGRGYSGAILHGTAYDTEEEFTDAMIAGLLAKAPTPDDIRSRLVADYTTALVYGDQDLAAAEVEAENIRAGIEAASASRREAYLQAHILEQQIQHEAAMQRLERSEREIKLDAMRQAEIEHARQYIQEVGNPFVQVVQDMRNRMAEKAQQMLESVQKNGFLKGKVAEFGRGLLEFYDIMACHDDQELRMRLERLNAEIGPSGTERNIPNIESLLGQIVYLSNAEAEELTETTSSMFIDL